MLAIDPLELLRDIKMLIQMGLAALVGIAVGYAHDGTARGMTGAIAAVALAALVSYLALVRRRPVSGRGPDPGPSRSA